MPLAASISQRRDPKTGAFTTSGTANAHTLRKAWRVTSAKIKPRLSRAPSSAPAAAPGSGSPLVSFSALTGLRNDAVDTANAVIRGVSVLTSGLVARGHALAVDSTTLSQMKAAAEAKGKVPVKVNHKSGAEAVCGYLDNFRTEGAKLKADWHLLKTHPQKDQILEVAKVMPSGVGLSASFLPPEKAEAGKARVAELLSVDYVTLPAANPDGLFSARIDRPQRREPVMVTARRLVTAGAIGAAGAAGIAAQGVDRLAGLGIRRLRPSPRVRAGIIGAAGAIGAAEAVRAVAKGKRPPRYPDDSRRRELAADFTRALVAFGLPHAEAKRQAAALAQAEHEQAAPLVLIKPRRSLGKRVAIRAAKVGVGAAGGAYIGRKLGTAAGTATGAAAGLLFQSNAARNAVRVGLNRSAQLRHLYA